MTIAISFRPSMLGGTAAANFCHAGNPDDDGDGAADGEGAVEGDGAFDAGGEGAVGGAGVAAAGGRADSVAGGGAGSASRRGAGRGGGGSVTRTRGGGCGSGTLEACRTISRPPSTRTAATITDGRGRTRSQRASDIFIFFAIPVAATGPATQTAAALAV